MKSLTTGTLLVLLVVGLTGCETLNPELIQSVLGGLSGKQELTLDTIASGLREALAVGTQNAVTSLSRDGGYADNPSFQIPLPEQLTKMASTLRTVGLGGQVDAFVGRMNEAAEKAAVTAGPVFLNAIKSMSFADAKAILTGNDTAATDYFRTATSDELRKLYMPLVRDKLEQTKAVKLYNTLVDRYNKIPLVPKISFAIEDYVTDRALTGLFSAVADQERMIREDPAARTTALLRKVFGASR